jgi:hypothetical protein
MINLKLDISNFSIQIVIIINITILNITRMKFL